MKTANASAIPSTNDPVRGHPSGHTVTRRTGSVTSPSHSPGSVEAHRFDKSARRQARNSGKADRQCDFVKLNRIQFETEGFAGSRPL